MARQGRVSGPEGSAAATAAGFGAVLVWSASVALTRSLGESLGPLTAIAFVYGIAAVPAIVRLIWRGLPRPAPAPRYLACCGALFVSYTLCLFLSIAQARDRLQAMEVGLLNYLWPVLTLLFCLPVLRRRPGPVIVPGTALALAGIYLVTTGQGGAGLASLAGNLASNPAAYGLGLGAAVTWGLYSALTRAWSGGRAGGVDFFIPATALVLLPLAFLSGEENRWTATAALEGIFYGGATFSSYRLWDLAMRRGSIVPVAAFSYLTPLFSSLVSALYLGVMPGTLFWAGCLLLVAGSSASWHSVSRPGRARSPAADP